MANKMFEVVNPISSTHYARDFAPGEIIDLGFASDEDVALLVASGAVKPSQKQSMTPTPKTEEAIKLEVKNG